MRAVTRAIRAAHRPVDRIEIAVRAAVALVAVLAVPLAIMIGVTVHRAEAATARPVDVQRVVATVTSNVPAQLDQNGMVTTVTATARWHTRRGGTRTGPVQLFPPVEAGSRVTIWVDPAGNPTRPPITAGDLVTRQLLVTGLAVVAQWFLLGLVLLGAHHWATRVRHAAWAREWRIVEPLWTDRMTEPPG